MRARRGRRPARRGASSTRTAAGPRPRARRCRRGSSSRPRRRRSRAYRPWRTGTLVRRMAAGEKPYRVYRGGRTKGKVPLQRRVERDGRGPRSREPQRQVVRRPRQRWSWRRRIAVGVLVLVVVVLVWLVAGYFAVRGGVGDANKR